MFVTEKKVVYRAFDLRIISDLPLPELPQLYDSNENVDIEIIVDALPRLWLESDQLIDKFYVVDNRVMFQVPGIATFLIEDGSKIIVTPEPHSKIEEIRLYVLGSCMGALLMQRGILPLHGSAVMLNGKAYAIVGDSGAGKSTLATALINKGYKLITDDVIAVRLSDKNLPIVTSSYPQQKLWRNSLQHFNLDETEFQPICNRETKYTVPVKTSFYEGAIPLSGIFELTKAETSSIEVKKIEKLELLRSLFHHTYRNFLIPKLGLMDWHFQFLSSICKQINMNKLIRPTNSFTVNELVTLITQIIEEED